MDFHSTHLIDIWFFQNRIPAIVDLIDHFLIDIDLNSVFTRQTPVKIAYKPGLDYLLECFLLNTFARIISVLPEKFQNFRIVFLSVLFFKHRFNYFTGTLLDSVQRRPLQFLRL